MNFVWLVMPERFFFFYNSCYACEMLYIDASLEKHIALYVELIFLLVAVLGRHASLTNR